MRPLTQKILLDVGEGHAMNDSFNKIGETLQSARKARGLRTADVARELRISADYLRLLELGEFDQLPAPTYVSGFQKLWKVLGLDGADLAGRFYAISSDASSAMDYVAGHSWPASTVCPAVASLFVVLCLLAMVDGTGSLVPDADATVESELAVVEIDNKKPGLMEKMPLGRNLKQPLSNIWHGTAYQMPSCPDDVVDIMPHASRVGADEHGWWRCE